MTLSQRLKEYVAAAFAGLWVQSHEHEDALAEVAQLCRDERWALAVWDVDRGLRTPDARQPAAPAAAAATDPVAAVRSLAPMAAPDGSALLVLPNFHRFLQSAEVVQALAHQVAAGKRDRTFVVVLSPVVQVPVELEKLFVVVEHDLPDREQIRSIAAGVATEAGELPDGEGLARLLDAAAGLTRYEAEGAFSLSLVRHGRLEPDAVWELKTQALKKGGLLTLHRGGERFADLGGLDALKAFCTRALRSRDGAADPRVRARGILLLGVPGTGKSAFAKALGNETGRPTLVLDVGSLMGSLVGQTEANVRQALKIVDAMAPCVLFVDELEKALAGTGSGGQADSGVGARLFGSLLTWLSDHASDVFFVGTSNDVSRLPPEFSRAERFDGVYFIDLPGTAERDRIWEMYCRQFNVADRARPRDADWTGAEIRSCCRLAALLDVPLAEAARHVVPVAATAAESVERLRHWASGRCLSASSPGVYARGGPGAPPASSPAGRKVSRSSQN